MKLPGSYGTKEKQEMDFMVNKLDPQRTQNIRGSEDLYKLEITTENNARIKEQQMG